jgi:hypothetical protein
LEVVVHGEHNRFDQACALQQEGLVGQGRGEVQSAVQVLLDLGQDVVAAIQRTGPPAGDAVGVRGRGFGEFAELKGWNRVGKGQRGIEKAVWCGEDAAAGQEDFGAAGGLEILAGDIVDLDRGAAAGGCDRADALRRQEITRDVAGGDGFKIDRDGGGR